MKVRNRHQRIINEPIESVAKLFKTLATKEDAVWPKENWPAMRFKEGLKMGSKGGHGPIRYTIVYLNEGKAIRFEFTKPDGFVGTHELMIKKLSEDRTEVSHDLNVITTSKKATFLWLTTIRWLHDALIEEAFDKIENQFSKPLKKTNYNVWVKLLRDVFKRKPVKTKHA